MAKINLYLVMVITRCGRIFLALNIKYSLLFYLMYEREAIEVNVSLYNLRAASVLTTHCTLLFRNGNHGQLRHVL